MINWYDKTALTIWPRFNIKASNMNLDVQIKHEITKSVVVIAIQHVSKAFGHSLFAFPQTISVNSRVSPSQSQNRCHLTTGSASFRDSNRNMFKQV